MNEERRRKEERGGKKKQKTSEDETKLISYFFLPFFAAIFSGSLKVLHRQKDPLLADLQSKGFAKINESFDYLLNTPIYALTEERMQKLTTDRKKKEDGKMKEEEEKKKKKEKTGEN